jgi:hypothetical protein
LGGQWTVEPWPCGQLECGFGEGGAFAAQFDKSCIYDTDCTKATIYEDCCRTPRVVGVNVTRAQELRDFWASCAPTLPSCGCSPGYPIAENGATALQETLILVKCNLGQCTTFAP